MTRRYVQPVPDVDPRTCEHSAAARFCAGDVLVCQWCPACGALNTTESDYWLRSQLGEQVTAIINGQEALLRSGAGGEPPPVEDAPSTPNNSGRPAESRAIATEPPSPSPAHHGAFCERCGERWKPTVSDTCRAGGIHVWTWPNLVGR